MTFGERIRRIIDSRGDLSQPLVAARMGVSQQRVSYLVRAKKTPKVETIIRLAAAMQVRVIELLEDVDDAKGLLRDLPQTTVQERGDITHVREAEEVYSEAARTLRAVASHRGVPESERIEAVKSAVNYLRYQAHRLDQKAKKTGVPKQRTRRERRHLRSIPRPKPTKRKGPKSD